MGLYNRSKKKAIQHVLKKVSPRCKIDPATITKYFKNQYKASGCKPFDNFENVVSKPNKLDNGLIRPFTRQEVRRIFEHVKDTAPGEDRIKYNELRKFDPSFYLLTIIYNRCLKEQKIPPHWKRAYTILIHKKGEESNTENWRPIALTNSIYKIYTGLWAHRLHQYPELISP
uniref:Reverse transcriptase n=1 Tax=Acrobeloides nanus TaxID=290746 RepID=A0A914DKQ9_9BILA